MVPVSTGYVGYGGGGGQGYGGHGYGHGGGGGGYPSINTHLINLILLFYLYLERFY